MFDRDTRAHVTRMAQDLGVEPAALLAVIEVESAGVATWNVGGQARPPIRFEGHYFHKRLKGANLQKAVSQGLAHPKAGAVKNPKSYAGRYALLERAKAISPNAAMESTSYGLGQVMGTHWWRLGFSSVQQMVDMAESGVVGQVTLMVRYIEEFGLTGALHSKDWTSFAHGYNGPAHAKNNYAGKMKAAYKRYSGSPSSAEDASVKLWQQDLKTLGYYKGAVDGIAGSKSRAAVRSFQRAEALVEDGIVGPMVLEAIAEEMRERKLKQAEKIKDLGAGTTGTGGAGEIILEGGKSLQPIANNSQVIQMVIVALVVIGVALIGYSIYKKRKA